MNGTPPQSFDRTPGSSGTRAHRPRTSLQHVYSPTTTTPSRPAIRTPGQRGAKPNIDFSTPTDLHRRKLRQSLGGGFTPGTPNSVTRKRATRLVVKIGWWEWFSTLPERWLFKLEMLPYELSLPSPARIGTGIGMAFHVLNLFVRWSEVRRMKEEDYGWEDMAGESSFVFDDEDGTEDYEKTAWVRWVSTRRPLLHISIERLVRVCISQWLPSRRQLLHRSLSSCSLS